MMNFIPILSLKYIVYPTESLNLRLSEKENIQLIEDCLKEKKPFGIILNDKNLNFKPSYGTLSEVTEIAKILKNGSIYVRIKGKSAFQILEIKEDLPGKGYRGAIVSYPPEEKVKVSSAIEDLIGSEVKRLYKLMHLEKKFPIKTGHYRSYDFAHKIGLKLSQEYELLTLTNELQRMEYLRRHLKVMMPVVKELEAMKKRIKMNGHFRNLS